MVEVEFAEVLSGFLDVGSVVAGYGAYVALEEDAEVR